MFRSLSGEGSPAPGGEASLISTSLSAEHLSISREESITYIQVAGRRQIPKLQEGIPDVKVAERRQAPKIQEDITTEFHVAER